MALHADLVPFLSMTRASLLRLLLDLSSLTLLINYAECNLSLNKRVREKRGS